MPTILPKPSMQGPAFEEVVLRRRTARSLVQRDISPDKLAQLLFAAAGVSGQASDRNLRTVPSAGALYPIEVLVAINQVKDMRPGIYRYRSSTHQLELLVPGDTRREMMDIGLGQRLFETAAITLILTAISERTQRKYRHLTQRFVHMEAGHTAQNVLLQATAMGLGSVPVGLFKEVELHKLLGLVGSSEQALYLIAVGERA